MTFPYRMFFLRHGETSWNVEGRLQGQRDIPLDPRGIDQAGAAGRAVRRFLGSDSGAALAELDFHASPLARARVTMELARRAMGLPPQPYAMDDRLKEISFGDWEGCTWREIKARDPERADARARDKWGYAPPGGESYQMLAERLRSWLETLDSDSLVVSHGGVARALMVLLGGADPASAPTIEVWQGRALLFEGGGFRWL